MQIVNMPSAPTRFEQELELVTLLPHPGFLSYLSSSKILNEPTFIAYLDYLQYWSQEPYIRYLSHPGPTLKVLQLLQHQEFRRGLMRPEVLANWASALMEAAGGVQSGDDTAVAAVVASAGAAAAGTGAGAGAARAPVGGQ